MFFVLASITEKTFCWTGHFDEVKQKDQGQFSLLFICLFVHLIFIYLFIYLFIYIFSFLKSRNRFGVNLCCSAPASYSLVNFEFFATCSRDSNVSNGFVFLFSVWKRHFTRSSTEIHHRPLPKSFAHSTGTDVTESSGKPLCRFFNFLENCSVFPDFLEN